MPSALLIRPAPAGQGVQPVETYEVVEAVAAILASSALGLAFREHLGNGDAERGARLVHTHRVPLRDQNGDEGDSAPVWALLREMGSVTGQSPERPSGIVAVPLQLQISLDSDQIGRSSPDALLSYGHVLAAVALEGRQLAVQRGAGRFESASNVTRTDRPSPARIDPDTGRVYSSALYSVTLRPLPL